MERRIDQAVILAAGFGTRLRPITDSIPKAMVPISPGVPLLEHTIVHLKKQGFRRFVINLHYLPEKIREHFGNGEKLGVEIVYSEEKEILETGGALKKMEHLLDDDFALVYGDHLFSFDLKPVITSHLQKEAVATIVLKRSDLPEKGEIYEINDKTKKILHCFVRPHGIKEFENKYWLNSGLYVLSKKILDYIPPNQPIKLDIEIMPKVISSGAKLYGWPTDEEILDIGTPAGYEYAQAWYKKHF